MLKKGKQLLLLIRHSTCLLLQNVCSFHNTIIKDFLYLILMCTKNVIFMVKVKIEEFTRK